MNAIFVDINSMKRLMIVAFAEDDFSKAHVYLDAFYEKAKLAGAMDKGYLWENLEKIIVAGEGFNAPDYTDEQIDMAIEAMAMMFPKHHYFGCGGPSEPYLGEFELGEPIMPRFDLD